MLPHPPRDSRTFPTKAGKGIFTVSPLQVVQVPEGRLVLQSLRSHDQFNTTVYGLDDRYRGIHQGRRVVFVNAEDLRELGRHDGEVIDLVSEWEDGVERCAKEFRLVEYDTPKGCAAAYYPETNPLVPLDSIAEASNTPTSKWVVVRLEDHDPDRVDRRPRPTACTPRRARSSGPHPCRTTRAEPGASPRPSAQPPNSDEALTRVW